MSPNAAGRPGAAQKAGVDLAVTVPACFRVENATAQGRVTQAQRSRELTSRAAKALEKYSHENSKWIHAQLLG